MKQKLYVVGDKYSGCLVSPGIVSQSMLEQKIKEGVNDEVQYEIFFGQGNDFQRISRLLDLLKANNLENKYQLSLGYLREKANNNLVHKRFCENVMITEPEKVHGTRYGAFIILDDKCDVISDHTQGQHLSGMLLIEAARQMTIAVTEKYYLKSRNRGNLEFVTNSLNAVFHKFLYPFEIYLDYVINSTKGFLDNQKFDVSISLMQADMICTVINYKFSVLNTDYVQHECIDMLLHNLSLIETEEA